MLEFRVGKKQCYLIAVNNFKYDKAAINHWRIELKGTIIKIKGQKQLLPFNASKACSNLSLSNFNQGYILGKKAMADIRYAKSGKMKTLGKLSFLGSCLRNLVTTNWALKITNKCNLLFFTHSSLIVYV